jgi:hypothetical protein
MSAYGAIPLRDSFQLAACPTCKQQTALIGFLAHQGTHEQFEFCAGTCSKPTCSFCRPGSHDSQRSVARRASSPLGFPRRGSNVMPSLHLACSQQQKRLYTPALAARALVARRTFPLLTAMLVPFLGCLYILCTRVTLMRLLSRVFL